MQSNDVAITRGGVLLEPDLADERELEGVLNPAVAGDYLLYRAVGRGNYSRLMAATLHHVLDENGRSHITATALNQVVLEPQTAYEITREGHGGIEDPRITQLPDGLFVMFYTGHGRGLGFTRQTPVVAVATSTDGIAWNREGRLIFAKHRRRGQMIDFNIIANKDTVLFSEQINGRFALLHRPMFSREQAAAFQVPWRGIWYAEADTLLGPWEKHRLVLTPKYPWEMGGVGAGVPPIHLRDAWVHIYHGFTPKQSARRYSAGVFTTPHDNPWRVAYRSEHTLLEPKEVAEQAGTVPHVVFPTAVWRLPGKPTSLAVFWGAADTRIMWGLLRVPSEVVDVSFDGEHVA